MPAILYEQINGVAVIRLNRPDKMNAFNREMSLQLQRSLDNIADDKGIRAVLLAASGTAFSAGQDLAEVADPSGGGLEKILTEQYNPIINKIRNLSKPVLCAVHGIAAGAGANVALSCDIVIAAQSAFFIQAFSKIGLIPDSGGTYFLPRMIGLQKSAGLMMFGEKLAAADAERIGLIYKVLPDEGFYDAAIGMAQTLSQMPTRALALTKQALNASFNNTLTQQLELEDELQKKAAAGKDFTEGVTAFLQKRKPLFTGE